ncbi:amidohydrolase [Geomonas sp. RF6]|uniref:amidohydrolase family protein n=1 Tax=Geomonas sp. RF6 TaxID=2897342 RepID=UPI001E560058|nr:amidohydrolase family protein [Geomonas sp. RF6]UFS68840.1 amidohydrolase [Geomonas sp. RF6]
MAKNRRDGEHDEFPLPTKILSNGEFTPPPQSENQKKVERRINELTDTFAGKLGMDRRAFLKTSCGMAVAFMAMNEIYGYFFDVSPCEAAEPNAPRFRQLGSQFIFDVQTHFVRDRYTWKGTLPLREEAKKKGWNPELKGEKTDLDKVKFQNYLREIFVESDTSIALLTSAPFDQTEKWFLFNDEMAKARAQVNKMAGSKRLYCHALFTPGRPGWLKEMDLAIPLKPDSWKGYTVGAPFENSKYHWRLDDEKLVYPAYEKMVKAGIKNVCIHKGILPPGYNLKMMRNWQASKVDDVGKAAKDWPQLNFIIYHSALKMGVEPPEEELSRFEKDGRIEWVSDLAEVPAKYGVKNVYGELGASFAASCVSHPRFCAGMLGQLVKGLGADHVLWGTDSVWYGSPQWQIEAFRRIEIPPDMQQKYSFAALGPVDGEVKNMIFGENAARLYGIDVNDYKRKAATSPDNFAILKDSWVEGEEAHVSSIIGG